MKLTPLIIAGGVVVVGIAGGILLTNRSDRPDDSLNQKYQTVTDEAESTVNISEQETTDTVPLPTEADAIRSFFSLIDTGRPDGAVRMMSHVITDSDSYKQSYAVQFNAFKSVKVISIEPYGKENWTSDAHTYQVVVEAEIKPGHENEVIPNFGWENGQNARWITVTKENKLWKIREIATGP